MSAFATCAMREKDVDRGAGREPAPSLAMPGRTGYRLCWVIVLILMVGVGGCASGSIYTIQSADARDSNERASLYCEKRASKVQLERVEPRIEGDIDVFRCLSREE